MGLVDYSESESESEAPQKGPGLKAPPAKKPFQKVVDRSNPGKIVVNLPQEASSAPSGGEPPAKRARTENSGGGRFSSFNSFLPAPKNANKPAGGASSTAQARPKPGVNLKTSAEPGFSRNGNDEDIYDGVGASEGMGLPPPKRLPEPTMPDDQKRAEDVKLVGKPMMFKPLSVSRNTNKKKKTAAAAKPLTPAPSNATEKSPANGAAPAESAQPPPSKRVSLFSMHTEESLDSTGASSRSGAYEPLFEAEGLAAGPERPLEDFAYPQSYTTGTGSESLDTIANDLNLSAAERRELFGRDGGDGQMARKVINFNMDKEYQHNEELRASGEEQIHNPVRALQGGGKHSLRQLVHNVQNQREALEDSFAKGKTNRKEASSKYGW